MSSDLEKDNVMRTKRARRCESRGILPLHMSRFPCFLSDGGVLVLRDHCLRGGPEIREAVTSTIAIWDGLPHPLTRLFAPIPHRRSDSLTRLAAQSNPHPGAVRFFEHKRAIRSSSSSVVEVGSFGSGASRVVWKGGS